MEIDSAGALVSGGASGLGEATVRRLHGAGAQVVIADLNREKGEALADELGAGADFHEVNVTDADSVEASRIRLNIPTRFTSTTFLNRSSG
jgi:NAD(P)-dependent dehydrogenase (short-subunit alcohol dehydrogenase family)